MGGGALQHPRGQRGVSQLPGGDPSGAAGGRLQRRAGGVHGALVTLVVRPWGGRKMDGKWMENIAKDRKR